MVRLDTHARVSGLELIFTHQKGEVHENTKQDGYREADQ